MEMDAGRFYTLQEIAEILKVSYMTVFRWVKSGKLKSVKAGKQYRVKALYLEEFLIKTKENEN